MDRATLTKKRPNLYVCLGLLLALTFVSITLILAKGLDSNRFFSGVTWMLAGLPISLTVPLFIGFDFFERTYHPDDPIPFCALLPKGAERTRKFAFLLGIVGVLAAIVFFFIYNANEKADPVKTSLVFLIPLLPSFLLYAVPMVPLCLKTEKKEKGIVLIVLILAALGAAVLLIIGAMKSETTYLVSYIIYPLCVLIMMFYSRED